MPCVFFHLFINSSPLSISFTFSSFVLLDFFPFQFRPTISLFFLHNVIYNLLCPTNCKWIVYITSSLLGQCVVGCVNLVHPTNIPDRYGDCSNALRASRGHIQTLKLGQNVNVSCQLT